jgi:hypothetical protein
VFHYISEPGRGATSAISLQLEQWYVAVQLIEALASLFSSLGWGETESTRYVPATDDDECGVVSGMRIGRGNRSARREPVTVPLYPPQVPHDLTRARNLAVAVGSQRLTA